MNAKAQQKQEIEIANKEIALKNDYNLRREKSIIDWEKKLRHKEKDFDEIVRQKTNKMVSEKVNHFKKSYQSVIFLTLLYGIVTTIITALSTEEFIADLCAFAEYICLWGDSCFRKMLSIGMNISLIAEHIKNPWLSAILHYGILILFFILIIGVVTGALGYVLNKYLQYMLKKQWDDISIAVALLDMIIIVYMGDIIKLYVSINLLVLFFLIFMAYNLVRYVFQMEDKEKRTWVIKGAVVAVSAITLLVLGAHLGGLVGICLVVFLGIYPACYILYEM